MMWFYGDDDGTAINMAHVVSIEVVAQRLPTVEMHAVKKIHYEVTACTIIGAPFVLATYDTEEAAKLYIRDICHQMNHPEEWRGGGHEV